MRAASAFVSLLAAAGSLWIMAGCDISSPPQDLPQGIPKQVQQLIESRSLTDQEIGEKAELEPTGRLWPPLPNPDVAVYAVTFVWGSLLGPGMPPFPVVDWSGKLGVSAPGGAVRVIRAIDFEEGEDRLLEVSEPAVAAWESKTAGDFDGLALLIRLPDVSTADFRAPELTFSTDPISVTLPFSKLERLLAYYPVGNDLGLAVLARRVDKLACPRGFMEGEWVPEAADGSCGSLRGMWYDLFGIPVATMAGSFGTDSDGSRYIEGSLSGVFLTVVLAELKGTWLRVEGQVRLEGRYHYLTSREYGLFCGQSGGGAPLLGIWRADCPELVATPPLKP